MVSEVADQPLLGIIQDDARDWEREAARMAAVYENCHLCIAADASNDDSSGCFPSQQSRMDCLYVSPDVLSTGRRPMYANAAPVMADAPRGGAASYASQGTFMLFKRHELGATAEMTLSIEWMPSSRRSDPRPYNIPQFGCPIDPPAYQPLSTRAWTLQERLLSPRTIHYAQDQMYWECKVCMLGEDGCRISTESIKFSMEQLIAGQRLPLDQHGIGASSGLSLIEGYPPVASGEAIGRWKGGWLWVVEQFTTRQVTVGDDKLPALSGLANRLAIATGDTYYAGLWRAHILEDLNWRVYAREESRVMVPGGFAHVFGAQQCTPARTARYRAPSWSWASLDAHIIFVHLDFRRILTEFIDCHVTPAGLDPFGRVTDGWIKLKGPLKEVSRAPASFKPPIEDPLGFGVLVQLQHETGIAYGEAFFDLDARFPCSALFLDPSNALLLTPSTMRQGHYVRIGIAKFLRTVNQRQTRPILNPDMTLGNVPYGPIESVDTKVEVTIS